MFRLFLYLIFSIVLFKSVKGQEEVPSFDSVEYDIQLRIPFIKDTVYFVTGKKGYFSQDCYDNIPSVLSDHKINVRNHKISGIPFQSQWNFEDTILVKSIFL